MPYFDKNQKYSGLHIQNSEVSEEIDKYPLNELEFPHMMQLNLQFSFVDLRPIK